ncbi:hypothetical protein J3F83DRAFT_755692 [Trichoderma novae-zelandiae]
MLVDDAWRARVLELLRRRMTLLLVVGLMRRTVQNGDAEPGRCVDRQDEMLPRNERLVDATSLWGIAAQKTTQTQTGGREEERRLLPPGRFSSGLFNKRRGREK